MERNIKGNKRISVCLRCIPTKQKCSDRLLQKKEKKQTRVEKYVSKYACMDWSVCNNLAGLVKSNESWQFAEPRSKISINVVFVCTLDCLFFLFPLCASQVSSHCKPIWCHRSLVVKDAVPAVIIIHWGDAEDASSLRRDINFVSPCNAISFEGIFPHSSFH